MLAIVTYFYQNPILSFSGVLIATLLLTYGLQTLKNKTVIFYYIMFTLCVYVALTLMLLLTMSVVSPDVVGVRMSPVWNPAPGFLLAFGGEQINQDQQLLLVANVLMTIPMAAFLCVKLTKIETIISMSILIFAIESAQYLIADGRTFETLDFLTNLLGVYIGTLLSSGVSKKVHDVTGVRL